MSHIKLIASKLWSWKWIITTVILTVFTPAIAYCMMESFINSYKDMSNEILMFNLLFVYLIEALFLFITWSPRWATAITVALLCLIGTVEYAVLCFRASPILPWDIFSVGTAISVVGNYKFVFTPNVIKIFIGYAIMLALIILGCRAKVKKSPWFVRVACVLLCVILGTGYTSKAQDSTFQWKMGYYPHLFTPTVVYKRNGFFFSFTSLLKYLDISQPEGYDAKILQNAANEYSNGPDSSDDNLSEKPNVIVIMNESFSDLSVLADIDVTTDYKPFISTLTENTIKGQVYTSVKGGNTPNSEYEFLTGDTMAFLPAGSIPYQQYMTFETDGFISSLKNLGYTTVAMHPYNASGWKRNTVYPLLDFDESFFLPHYSKMERVRGYVSDRAVVDAVIRQYNENLSSGNPFAAFCVTMQNHGGYTDGTSYKNFDITASINGVTKNKPVIDTYLSLVELSDAAFEYIVEYFSAVDEKTIIVMFGDHQPNSSVTKHILSANGIDENTDDWNVRKNQFSVPFVIWANYDIEEQTDVVTSLNYLNIYVSEAAGFELSGYQKFRRELMKEYPVVTANFCIDSRGNLITRSEMDSAGILSEYRQYQYNHLFDKKNLLTGFFD